MTRLRPLLALLLFACAPNNGLGPHTDPEPELGRRIEVVGAPEVAADAQSELPLSFRYMDGASPVANAVVDLAVLGDAAGATLDAASAVTDASGIATVSVRTDGQARFEVEASAPGAQAGRVIVSVRQMLRADLGVQVRYEGSRRLTGAEVGVFVNAGCDSLRTAVPLPRAASRVAVGGRSEFGDLEMGVPVAVYVLGIDAADQVAAETCSDVTLDGDRELEVGLADVAVRVNGPYATVERFDVTDGFSGSIDTILEVLGVIGSPDPALAIVEMVADSSSTPGWVRTALSTSFTRRLVADLFRDAFESIHLPSEVEAVAGFGADVNSAFSGLTFDGELDFAEPDEFGVTPSRHRLTRMRVPLADGSEGMRLLDEEAEPIVTFDDRIDVDEHAFDLPFGEVAELVIEVAGLSGLPGSPRTIGELVGSYVDCDAISARMGTGTTADLANAACEVGVGMLRVRVDNAIGSLWSYDTLYLAGDADLADADGDYDYERIELGVATARWVGADGQLDFSGEFEGASIDDAPRAHRVRDRLVGLE